MFRIASVANQRYFIEVNTELCHGVMRLMDKIETGLTGTS